MTDRFVLDVDAVRADLLELVGLRAWEALQIGGEVVGGAASIWRAFVATATDEQLRSALDAAWGAWVDTTVTPAQEKMARRWFREPVRIR